MKKYHFVAINNNPNYEGMATILYNEIFLVNLSFYPNNKTRILLTKDRKHYFETTFDNQKFTVPKETTYELLSENINQAMKYNQVLKGFHSIVPEEIKNIILNQNNISIFKNLLTQIYGV